MSASIESQYTFLSQHNKGIPFQRAKNSNYIQVWIQWLEGLWRFWNVVGDQKLVGGTKCCSLTVILMIIIMPTTSEAPPRSLQHDATFPSPTLITLISTLKVKIRRQFSPTIMQTVHIYTVLAVKGILSSHLWWKLRGRNGVKRTGAIIEVLPEKNAFAVVSCQNKVWDSDFLFWQLHFDSDFHQKISLLKVWEI